MIQGSCRGTNGHGRDAMAPIDDLLRTLITDPLKRPHQMHLTGDQIYADEGAPELVEIIDKLTGELLGAQAGQCFETIHTQFPKADSDPAVEFDVPVDVAHLPPSRRSHLTVEVAHFTSDHSDSHAIGFGEYCGTYLTGWCNIPWEWNAAARMADAKTRFIQYQADVQALHAKSWNTEFKLDVAGLSSNEDKRDAIDEMIRYFAAWKLVPAAYRDIDKFMARDDVAAAWGKGNPDDKPRFDLWTNFAAAQSLPEPLPLDKDRLLAAPPSDDATKKFNRLARSLTPSWFTGNDLFEVTYDISPSDADKSKPQLSFKGSEEFNRIHRLQWEYEDLPKIRRILANIPTYMVFDDHEVTDDWNISYGWQKATRGNSLGRGIIRNALAAFTLFQYWGNDPRACRSGTAAAVLDHIEALFANATVEHPGPDKAAADWLEQTFDLNLLPDVPTGPTTGDPATRMLWHYRYDGPQFEVLALDSRTWRGAEIDANPLLREPFFPDASATLMTDEAMRMQIPEAAGAGINPNGVCFVIAAAPFLGFPPVESVAQPLINLKEMMERKPNFPFKRWKSSQLFGRLEHDPEPWGFRPELFEAVLARLNSRNRVIFYSGDVHYSFASHMNYWQLNPNGNPRAATRLVQLTASSFRAQHPTVASLFDINLLQQFGALASKTSRQGWHRGPAGSSTFGPPIQIVGATPSQHVTQSLLDDPILLSPDGLPPQHTHYQRPPEWVWEMDLDGDTRVDTERFLTTPPPSFSNASHLEMVQSVARRHAWSARYAMPRSWFWWTNFGFVSFRPDASGNAAAVVYQVYSYDPDGHEPSAQPFLTAVVDLTVKQQPDPQLVEVP
jgi:hypothetical protein